MDIVFRWIKSLSRKLVLLLACVLLTTLLLTGCDPHAGKYPCSQDAKWVCQEPKITLEYVWGEMNSLTCVETMEYNGETMRLEIGYLSCNYKVQLEGVVNYDDFLFEGRWKYRGEKLVFTITEDHFFDGKYPELVFERVPG